MLKARPSTSATTARCSLSHASIWLLFLAIIAQQLLAPVAAEAGDGYEVKAAFVLNFLKFTESTKFSKPVSLCLYGGLDAQYAFSKLDGLDVPSGEIAYQLIEQGDSVADCDVFFLAREENWRKLLEASRQVPLTIGEDETFIASGGLISFFTENDKIRFAINLEAARAKGVVFSSQLLRLARIESK